MNTRILLYLLAIYILSLTVFIICNKKYGFKKIFLVVYTLLLTLFGALSTAILAYIESGVFGGTSYFGAVFLLPVFLFLAAKIFKLKKVPYLFDLMALMGSVTLVVMKVRCYIEGCCSGRIIAYHADTSPIIFPSQIVEGINGLIILLILMYLIFKSKFKGKIYLLFMLIYGITRFILSYFRFYKPLIGNLSYGHIWSICSILISVGIIIYLKKCNKKN